MARLVETRRSQREWIVRALLALAVLGAGFWAVRQTLAALSRTGDPEQAYRLAPSDGRNAAALAQQALAAAAADGARSRPRLLAQEALRLDPTTGWMRKCEQMSLEPAPLSLMLRGCHDAICRRNCGQ
jgi:hypothetical protein